MRPLKIMLISLVLCGVGVLSPGCASDSTPTFEGQVATVQRGDLRIDITGVGNLSLSHTEDLAVDLFYQEGTIAEVLVEEGDTVEEGQVLVKLDASEWTDELAALEDKVRTAERNVTTKERDLTQAQINLNNAELSLEQTEETSTDPLEIKVKKLQVELTEGRLEDAQIAVEDAEEALADAQDELDEARSKSPEIVAPFDGFITNVNVEGGDEVLTGTIAAQLADPNQFEAYIMVSEMDILQVELGGAAWVEVDAMQGLSLPAEITHISPTATISQGVVNYEVKVEIKSMEAVAQERQAVRQEAMQSIQQGELPERLKQAIEEGRMTQEQAEEMMKQWQQGQAGQQGQVSAAIPENFQLREGLTVTVSIIVDERNDVLLVPNAAITTQGSQTFVQVLASDGTLEQRAIQKGISDYQFTEVTEGLSESEQIIVPEGTTTTTTTQQPRGGLFIPGMGGPPR